MSIKLTYIKYFDIMLAYLENMYREVDFYKNSPLAEQLT